MVFEMVLCKPWLSYETIFKMVVYSSINRILESNVQMDRFYPKSNILPRLQKKISGGL